METEYTSSYNNQPPPALVEKFHADGMPRPFAGNTIICHVPRGSALLSALKETLGLLGKASFSRKIAFLPPSSYHMTVFGGANDKHRRVPGAWPEGLGSRVTMDECNAEMMKRLRPVDVGPYAPLRMRVSPLPIQDTTMCLRLELEPQDEKEDQKLRMLRDTVATAMGLRTTNDEDYRFHITIGYLTGWLTDKELGEFSAYYNQCRDLVMQRVPKFDFGPLEFCTFEDMLYFERQMYVGGYA